MAARDLSRSTCASNCSVMSISGSSAEWCHLFWTMTSAGCHPLAWQPAHAVVAKSCTRSKNACNRRGSTVSTNTITSFSKYASTGNTVFTVSRRFADLPPKGVQCRSRPAARGHTQSFDSAGPHPVL